MLCKQCREHIEVGEACTTVEENGHTRYYHIGCNIRAKEEAENEDREFERIAELARLVH